MNRLYLAVGILCLGVAGCGDNTASVCGDGILDRNAGEQCDDGNLDSGDSCDATCLISVCGDGVVNGDDECDDRGESATCDADCTAVTCGDGVANAAAGEQCDDGGESAACDVDCSVAECGDGHLNAAAGEVCDDDNTDDLDGCSANCLSDESCGNVYLDVALGETCDDGNRVAGDGCTDACATEPYQICSMNIPTGIEDNATVTSELVPPFPYVIETMDVELDITHTSLADMTIRLSHGDTTVLIADNFESQSNPGVSCTGDNMRAILDDDADVPLEAACVDSGLPAIDGRFRPQGNLADFDGADVAGAWTLSVADESAGEVGSIDRWCLNLNGFGVPTRLAQVYWINSGSSLWRAGTDGSDTTEIVSGLSDNFVIATDPVNNTIYYDTGNPSAIMRADADGANPVMVVANGGSVFGLAVDPINGKLYWSDFSGDRIMRSDLDGANQEQIASATSPSGIALDIPGGKAYFITYNSTALHRVNVDGTEPEIIVPGLAGQGVGVAVDSTAGKVYYSTRANDIFVADLDGANASMLVTGQTAVQGIALDAAAGTLYWSAPLAGMIRSVDIADVSTIVDVTDSQGNAWGLAFMPAE